MNFRFLAKKSIFISLFATCLAPVNAAIITIPLNYNTESSVNNINDDLTLSGTMTIQIQMMKDLHNIHLEPLTTLEKQYQIGLPLLH